MPLHTLLQHYRDLIAHKIQTDDHSLLLTRLNCGFETIIRDETATHTLTKPFVVSVNRFSGGRQSNLVFDNSTPVNILLSDTELPSHIDDYIGLRYIMSGHYTVEIEGKSICFTQGQVCLINAMSLHRESIADSEGIVLNISIDKQVFTEALLSNIGLSALKQYLHSMILQRSEQKHYLCFSPPPGGDSAILEDYLTVIVEEIVNGKPGHQEICKGYLIRLIDFLSNSYLYNAGKVDSKLYEEKVFESVRAYMLTHLDTVSMKDLIENFHFQTNYFNNLVRKYTGMTYSAYLIKLRIERAKELLYSSDLPIEEIMWLVGYNNKGFFYRKFTEITGMSPKAYRSKSR